MPKYLGDVRCWVNSGKHVLALSFSDFDPTETFRNAASAARVCRHLLFDSGRKVSVPPDRLVAMTVEDSKPLLSIGWTTQNNLEIRETELMASRPIHD